MDNLNPLVHIDRLDRYVQEFLQLRQIERETEDALIGALEQRLQRDQEPPDPQPQPHLKPSE